MKPVASWVRWLLVLPVAFLIDPLAQFALNILSYLFVPESLEPFIKFLIWQGLGPLAFVAGGVIVSPKNKFLTSIVLGGFKAAITIYNASKVYAFINGGGTWNDIDSLVKSPAWWNMGVYAFCILGLIGLCIFVKYDMDKVRTNLGGFLATCGIFAYAIFGLWGFILSLRIVNEVAGFWGIVVGFIVAPITFVAAPWYAGIAWSNWTPLAISYGGIFIGAAFYYTGSWVARDLNNYL